MSPARGAEGSDKSGISDTKDGAHVPSGPRRRVRRHCPRAKGRVNGETGESVPSPFPPQSSTRPKTTGARLSFSAETAASPESTTPRNSVPSSSRSATYRRRNRWRADSNATQATTLSISDDPTSNAFTSQTVDDLPKGSLLHAQIDSHAPKEDLAQGIRDLVNDFRSIALDSHRPSSTSTHIDWAGENDDSLPDLDDWGFTSKSLQVTDDSVAHPSESLGITSIGKSSPAPSVAQPSATALPKPASHAITDGARIPTGARAERHGHGKDWPAAERGNRMKKIRSLDTSRLHAYLGSSESLAVPNKKTLRQRIGPPVNSNGPVAGFPNDSTRPFQPNNLREASKVRSTLDAKEPDSRVGLHSDSPGREVVVTLPVPLPGLAEVHSMGGSGEHSTPTEDSSSVVSNRTSDTKVDLEIETRKSDWADAASMESPDLSGKPSDPAKESMHPPLCHRPEKGKSRRAWRGGAASSRWRERPSHTSSDPSDHHPRQQKTLDSSTARPKIHRDALALISKNIRDLPSTSTQ